MSTISRPRNRIGQISWRIMPAKAMYVPTEMAPRMACRAPKANPPSIWAPQRMSVAGQNTAFIISRRRPRRNFSRFTRSKRSISNAWRANAFTTRTPVRFSCSVVERIASCSWYFS